MIDHGGAPLASRVLPWPQGIVDVVAKGVRAHSHRRIAREKKALRSKRRFEVRGRSFSSPLRKREIVDNFVPCYHRTREIVDNFVPCGHRKREIVDNIVPCYDRRHACEGLFFADFFIWREIQDKSVG